MTEIEHLLASRSNWNQIDSCHCSDLLRAGFHYKEGVGFLLQTVVVCCNPQCDPYVIALEKENLGFLEERLQGIGTGG